MAQKRAVRVANCSGYKGDRGWHMLRQASLGPVDFITGDYLAEMNIAENAEAYQAGKHEGWEETAWEGFQASIDILAERKIKVVINGGALNPGGLARRVQALAEERGHSMKVAYVSGDDLLQKLRSDPSILESKLVHLDSANKTLTSIQKKPDKLTSETVVSANAYIGARAIVEGLRAGADIIICGRVSDASPVIGAAWYWHSWKATSYNELAGSLIAGHLIECSAYASGGNFSGFTDYSLETFIEPGFPIADISADGSCIITKHPGTGGMITEDTIRCQLLYELQGNIYLHSDVKSYLDNVRVEQAGEDRVRVSGIFGKPPPPTTKLAIYYPGGYQSQMLLNATGYGTNEKWRLLEMQLRKGLASSGTDKELSLLEFQIVGVPEANPRNQLSSTTYCRLFAEAEEAKPLVETLMAFKNISLCHFSGFHSALDFRTAIPKSFLAYFPVLYPQDDLEEAVVLLSDVQRAEPKTISAGHPPNYEPLETRSSYDTSNPVDIPSLGRTNRMRLGDVVLARSGDKGSNLNCGLFVKNTKAWDWFRSFLSRERFIHLLGDDWEDEFLLERVEFPNIQAVHFVIYGILGRGVSGSTRLDSLGKGFADYFRDKVIDVPVTLLC